MKHIIESDMYFGDYLEENFFKIENSKLHLSFGEGIKVVEFLLYRKNDKLLFVEAKKTCPNAANKEESAEKSAKFEEYYEDIKDKFIDSLQMFLTTILKRGIEDEEIGAVLKTKTDYSKTGLCFVLVIRNADELWLAGPKAELEKRLQSIRKIWGIKIVVLNYELAMEYGLVSEM